jgi:hypothetical protein
MSDGKAEREKHAKVLSSWADDCDGDIADCTSDQAGRRDELSELSAALRHALAALERLPMVEAEVARLRVIERAGIRFVSETGHCGDADSESEYCDGTCDDEGCEYCRFARTLEEMKPWPSE